MFSFETLKPFMGKMVRITYKNRSTLGQLVYRKDTKTLYLGQEVSFDVFIRSTVYSQYFFNHDWFGPEDIISLSIYSNDEDNVTCDEFYGRRWYKMFMWYKWFREQKLLDMFSLQIKE